MTHQPGVYVPLRALFLVGIVFERSILHVHVYLKAKLRGNTAKTVNQVAETVPSL